MNCPNCGFLLPDDSKFCQYCGTVLSGNAPGNEPAHVSAVPEAFAPDAVQAAPAYAAPPAAQTAAPVSASAAPIPAAPAFAAQQAHKRKKTRQCKACGAQIDPHTKKRLVCGKPASRVQPAVLALAAVSVLLVCSLVVNLVQYGSAAKVRQEMEQQLESSNAAIAAQGSAILELEDQLSETEAKLQRSDAMLVYTKSELAQAQKEAQYFDLIRSFLAKSDAGYASDQFFASKSVLILSLTGKEQSFSLTTSFSSHSSISVSSTNNSADVYFTEDSWYDRTTVRVRPKTTGATYVTFSNSFNSQTFRVLIIVTD